MNNATILIIAIILVILVVIGVVLALCFIPKQTKELVVTEECASVPLQSGFQSITNAIGNIVLAPLSAALTSLLMNQAAVAKAFAPMLKPQSGSGTINIDEVTRVLWNYSLIISPPTFGTVTLGDPQWDFSKWGTVTDSGYAEVTIPFTVSGPNNTSLILPINADVTLHFQEDIFGWQEICTIEDSQILPVDIGAAGSQWSITLGINMSLYPNTPSIDQVNVVNVSVFDPVAVGKAIAQSIADMVSFGSKGSCTPFSVILGWIADALDLWVLNGEIYQAALNVSESTVETLTETLTASIAASLLSKLTLPFIFPNSIPFPRLLWKTQWLPSGVGTQNCSLEFPIVPVGTAPYANPAQYGTRYDPISDSTYPCFYADLSTCNLPTGPCETPQSNRYFGCE